MGINNVYQANWGQWQPGAAAHPAPPRQENNRPAPTPATGTRSGADGSSIPDININGSSVSGEQIKQGADIAAQLAQHLR